MRKDTNAIKELRFNAPSDLDSIIQEDNNTSNNISDGQLLDEFALLYTTFSSVLVWRWGIHFLSYCQGARKEGA
jgi:hypothetical protein